MVEIISPLSYIHFIHKEVNVSLHVYVQINGCTCTYLIRSLTLSQHYTPIFSGGGGGVTDQNLRPVRL